MELIQVNPENFEAEVLRSDKPVVVDFWAPGCSVCRLMEPIVRRMAHVFQDRVKITLCNVAEAPDLVQQFQIMASPTLVFFKDGHAVDTLVGYMDEAHLTTHMQTVLQA
jgi:thioredoxin 1